MTDISAQLRELDRARGRMALDLTGAMVVVYFGFILLVASAATSWRGADPGAHGGHPAWRPRLPEPWARQGYAAVERRMHLAIAGE